MKKVSLFLCILLISLQPYVLAQSCDIDIYSYTSRINNISENSYRPVHLRYLYHNPQNGDFKLLLDKGDAKDTRYSVLTKEAKNLIAYFFIGISLPNESFWVNLRPDSRDNIIDPALAQTDVGSILLEADLQLKKDTANLTSPETPEGKEYWGKLYKKAGEIFGYEGVTIPTLTRPWIVPDEILVRESGNSLYIYKATLKVMLEQDCLKGPAVYNFKDERIKELNEYSSQLIREIIIPKLTRKVNTSEEYAPLRKVYYSLILSQWFKEKFSGKGEYSLFINRSNLKGLTSKEAWSKEKYFKEYQASFKNGEYDIKEPIYTPYGQTIRSYFSGGVSFQKTQRVSSPATVPVTDAPDYTALISITGIPSKPTVVVGNLQKEPKVERENTYSQQLTELFQTRDSDEQIKERALGILETAFDKEGLSNIPQNIRARALQVARMLYLRPNIQSENISKLLGISREELREVYRLLRISDTLQGIITTETDKTSASGFIEFAMKKLLRYGDRLERIFNSQIVYPVVVEWHPGESCDSNCIFCYSRGLNYEDRTQGRLPLTIKRSKELLKEFADNDVREFWISGGKEPLVNPITADVIQYAADLGLETRLYTNGIRLVRYVQERILGCKQIRISLNAATPETYKQVQGINGENFNKVVQNIGDLVKLKKERGSSVNIGMSFVLNPWNYKEILQIAEIARKLGVDFLAIRVEQVGTIRKFDQDEIEEILKSAEVLRLNKDIGIYGSMELDFRSLTREDMEGEKHYFPNMDKTKICQVRNLKIGMSPYGVCYMCEYAEHPRNARPELEIGDASKMSFRDILKRSNEIKHDPSKCEACMINEYGLNIGLEKLKADRDFGIPLDEQPYRVVREREIAYKSLRLGGNNGDGVKAESSSPVLVGGIDFRALPIVTQAMSNLSLNTSRIPLSSLEGINLEQELGEIQRLVGAGITPSAERIKEYVQVSCLKGNPDMQKLVSCIADILRLEEERCWSTDATLKDILVVLESVRSVQELKAVFVGNQF